MRLFRNNKITYKQTYDLVTDEFVFTSSRNTYRVLKTDVTDQAQINVGDYAEGAWILLIRTQFNIRPTIGFSYTLPLVLG